MKVKEAINSSIKDHLMDNQPLFEEFDAIWDKLDKKVDKINIKTSSKSMFTSKASKYLGDFIQVAVLVAVLFGIPYIIPSRTENKNFIPTQITTPPFENSNSYTNSKIIDTDTQIVIYNTHMFEEYAYGGNVTNMSEKLSESLQATGFNASVINYEHPSPTYAESYSRMRKLIEDNVKDYKNSILLDIHRAADSQNKEDVLFVIGTGNEGYKENLNLAKALAENINASSSIKAGIIEYKFSKFNQDLSNNALLIEIGNSSTSKENLNKCVSAIVNAFKVISN